MMIWFVLAALALLEIFRRVAVPRPLRLDFARPDTVPLNSVGSSVRDTPLSLPTVPVVFDSPVDEMTALMGPEVARSFFRDYRWLMRGWRCQQGRHWQSLGRHVFTIKRWHFGLADKKRFTELLGRLDPEWQTLWHEFVEIWLLSTFSEQERAHRICKALDSGGVTALDGHLCNSGDVYAIWKSMYEPLEKLSRSTCLVNKNVTSQDRFALCTTE